VVGSLADPIPESMNLMLTPEEGGARRPHLRLPHVHPLFLPCFQTRATPKAVHRAYGMQVRRGVSAHGHIRMKRQELLQRDDRRTSGA